MPIVKLFSQQQAQTQGSGQAETLKYDELPGQLRFQVAHIWRHALGTWRPSDVPMYDPLRNGLWLYIANTIAEEKGLPTIILDADNPQKACVKYLLSAAALDALDMIQLSFQVIDRAVRDMHADNRWYEGLGDPDDAIETLNNRFRQHNIGYEFAGGRLMRVDSKLLQAEAIRPALQLLQGAGPGFSGPLDEYLEAHAELRKGDYKDAIGKALKSFESTLKAICTARAWAYDANKATAKDLLDIVFSNGLVPEYTQGFFGSIRALLETGVPTVRNRSGAGHGQGPQPIAVSPHLAAFVMHQTAAGIVFFIECHQALP